MTSITPEQAKAVQLHFQEDMRTSICEMILENKKKFKLMQDDEVVILKSNSSLSNEWDIFLLIVRKDKEFYVNGVPLTQDEQASLSKDAIFNALLYKVTQGQSILNLVYNIKKNKIIHESYAEFSSVITH